MFVLVVTREAATGELVRQTLGAEGWWVTAVADRETAVRSASDQAPELVVIDGEVEESAELVRFFASGNGGPGVVLLAPESGAPGASGEDQADEVLAHDPTGEKLAEVARGLLEKEPSPPAADGLPTPGQVLNAQDIFGDMLNEMDPGSELGELPPPPPIVGSPQPAAEAGEVSAARIETRAMVIPEPSMEVAEPDLDFSFSSAVEAEPADVPEASEPMAVQESIPEPAAPRPPVGAEAPEEAAPPTIAIEPEIAEPQIVLEQAAQPEPATDDPLAEEVARWDRGVTAEAFSEPAIEAEPEPVLELAAAPEPLFEPSASEEAVQEAAQPATVGERLAAMARRFKTGGRQKAAAELATLPEPMDPVPPIEDAAFAAPEIAFESVELELAPVPAIEAATPALEEIAVESVEPGPTPVPAAAPASEEMAGQPVTPEPELDPVSEADPVPPVDEVPPVAAEIAVEPVELEPDPVPPVEQVAVASEPEAVAAAAPDSPVWRRASLPGGARLWLGIAAGLLVFVAASFLLGRFFPIPQESPAAVAVPAADAVDLEELVDREMAQREAELRESLVEEERRLQEQLDELNKEDS